MVIKTNEMAVFTNRMVEKHSTTLSKSIERLATGYRINTAADDATGLAISEKMRAQITAVERASLNAQDGMSLLNVAEGAMDEIHSMTNRLVCIATYSANGVLAAEERRKLQDEVDAIKDEVNRVTYATKFQNIGLLDGSAGGAGIILQVGESGGESERITIPLPDLRGYLQQLFTVDVATQEKARQSLETVHALVEGFSSVRSQFGASHNRLESTVSALGQTLINLREAESRIRDLDVAKEMLKYMHEEILLQTALNVMTHTLEIPSQMLEMLDEAAAPAAAASSGGGGESTTASTPAAQSAAATASVSVSASVSASTE